MEKADSARLLDAIGTWIKKIDDYPGWKDWQRQKIGAVMLVAEGLKTDFGNLPKEFKFSPEIGKQHEAIMSYLSLWACLTSLQQCEFYFRRYPFSKFPVSKEDHLRNICEMYFSKFYEFKSRLKRCLNAVQDTLQDTLQGSINVGEILKAFSAQFDEELRARNGVHHHDRFDEVGLQGIGLATLMGGAEKVGEGWQAVARSGYRRSTSDWAKRARRRSKAVEAYVEVVASAMLQHCDFLEADRESPKTQ